MCNSPGSPMGTCCRLPFLSLAREGKLHDKKFHDEEKLIGSIPVKIPIEVDSGFQGIQHQYKNIRIPHKKPKGRQLNQQQKTENRTLSQSRVLCENAFAGVKCYGAVNHIYRNHKDDFDDKLMLTATGWLELVPDGSINNKTTNQN
ncbi:transposase family protein [Okeania sp. SIO2B3]|uniref:transposase family protein n=1 Tax=Okeania sp. SIO2B3 TaxID=2607784 RepID=UPI0025EC13B8|nr:transposase family protein [Okeania sp. SIO2B3]